LRGEDVWACEAYEESANHLRLVFPEGEIDFIVAAMITDLPNEPKSIDLSEIGMTACEIEVEHPVETAIKKLAYRGSMLKVRDIVAIRSSTPFVAIYCVPIFITSSISSRPFSLGSTAIQRITCDWNWQNSTFLTTGVSAQYPAGSASVR
jgi:hypothetical protein